MKIKLLLVEDEAITAMSMVKDLESLGYDVGYPIVTGEEAIERAFSDCPSIILMDINLIGDMDGIETIEKIHEWMRIPVIYMTGYSSREMKDRAIKTEPLAYLEKPVIISEIKLILEKAGFISNNDH